ncbi:hypothetical protein SAMN05443254_10883 [Bradyrhizobium sp. OK095]|nr:hypothetical protein SAMN05443254_10883 [Bradyrhizobium sp. OK095]
MCPACTGSGKVAIAEPRAAVMAAITSGANDAFEKFFMSQTGGYTAPPLHDDKAMRHRKFLCRPSNTLGDSANGDVHSSRAFENENELTRRVVSSKISVRVIGGSARWAQFSRSQRRQLTPIGVPSAFSRSIPAA